MIPDQINRGIEDDINNERYRRASELQKIEDDINERTRCKSDGGIEYVIDKNGDISFSGPINIFDLISLVKNKTKLDFKEIIKQRPQEHIGKLKKFLQFSLAPYPCEVFAAIWLDSKYRIIKYEKLFYGSENNVIIPCDIFIKSALNINASGVIISHNHPGLSSAPSDEDIKLTSKLQKALIFIGLHVVDHIVVSRYSTYSFRENNLLITNK